MRMTKNLWGAQNSNVDAQRKDLFTVKLDLPSALKSVGAWNETVEFALESFPFPERKRNTIPIKWQQQTNHLPGADVATSPIDIIVRYAFNQRTHEVLQRWDYLASNPHTGGVAQASALKCQGRFLWLIPDMNVQSNVESTSSAQEPLKVGLVYILEGCMITGLKPDGGDHTSEDIVKLTFNLSIDRWYPEDIRQMVVGVLPNSA